MGRILAIFLLFSLSTFAQLRVPLTKTGGSGSVNVPINKTGVGSLVRLSGPVTSFSLSTSAVTSLGVFNASGQLVRTISSNVLRQAGTFTPTWDGKDDFGTTVGAGVYTIKLVSNNLTYSWEGVIGNTSFTGQSASNLNGGYRHWHDVIIPSSSYLYTADQYAEGPSAVTKHSLTDVQKKLGVYPYGTAFAIEHLASDGTRLYGAGYEMDEDNFSPRSGVRATLLSNDSPVVFSSGTKYKPFYVPDSISFAGFRNDTSYRIKGIAVLKTGNYLFVSYQTKNLIEVRNKLTGALVQSLTVSAPKRMTVDANDNLYVISGTVINKYTVAGNGTIGSPTLTLSGLTRPLALGVTPDGATIAVVDGGSSQQVKAYSTSTGTFSWTLGTLGGYATNPTVNTSKFYFDDQSGAMTGGYVAFQPDGSFWVGDVGNYRALHYSSSRTYLEQVAYVPNNYSVYVDRNNPTRVFAQFLEYQVDYAKGLLEPGAWSLVRNWRGGMLNGYLQLTNLRQNVYLAACLKGVTTLGNGRTYAITNRMSDAKQVLVELPSSGPLRVTSIVLDNPVSLLADGSLLRKGGSGSNLTWTKQTISSFDGSNNPVYGSAAPIAQINATTTLDPIDHTGGEFIATLSDDLLISFDKNRVIGGGGTGYHLGAVKLGSSSWKWRTALATTLDYAGEYPTDGSYDIGNTVNYGGGREINTVGPGVLWNYHGENWKNGQTNYWHYVHNSGLQLGQFGTSTQEAARTGNYAGMAGNVLYGQVVQVANAAYIYHGEEAGWFGVHRWKIDNLSSIQEQNVPAVVVSSVLPAGTVDVLADLPRSTTLASGQAGLTRSGGEAGERTVRTSYLTYNRLGSTDLFTANNNSPGEFIVTKSLGTFSGLTSYTLSATLEATKYYPNVSSLGQSGSGGVYLDLLDNAGKLMVRYEQQLSGSTISLKANGSTLVSGNYTTGNIIRSFAPISLVWNGGNFVFSYNGANSVTVPKSDATSTPGSPATIRIYYWNNGANQGRQLGLSNVLLTATPAP